MKNKKEVDTIDVLYRIGERFLGKNFLQGNSFTDFIKDGARLGIFMFSPWVLLATTLILETLIKTLIGGN